MIKSKASALAGIVLVMGLFEMAHARPIPEDFEAKPVTDSSSSYTIWSPFIAVKDAFAYLLYGAYSNTIGALSSIPGSSHVSDSFNYLANYSDVESGPTVIAGEFAGIEDPAGPFSYIPLNYFGDYGLVNLKLGAGKYQFKDDKDYSTHPEPYQVSVADEAVFDKLSRTAAGKVVAAEIDTSPVLGQEQLSSLFEPVDFQDTESFAITNQKGKNGKLDVSEIVSPFILRNSRHEKATGRVIKVQRHTNLSVYTNTCYVTLHEGGSKQGQMSPFFARYDHAISKEEYNRRQAVLKNYQKRVTQQAADYQKRLANNDRQHNNNVASLEKSYNNQLAEVSKLRERMKKVGLSGEIKEPTKPTLPVKPEVPVPGEIEKPLEAHWAELPDRPNTNTYVVISEDVCRFAEDAAKAFEPVAIGYVGQAEGGYDYVTSIQLQRPKQKAKK